MKFGPMVETYGLNFQVANPVDIMMKYTLIEQGAYDVMVVYATDGLNKRANLTLLDDDQHFFPDYYGTILARSDVFETASRRMLPASRRPSSSSTSSSPTN